LPQDIIKNSKVTNLKRHIT